MPFSGGSLNPENQESTNKKILNSPGRRPNGVYDRFPLGGFTLLYGSLLGSSPPPDGISTVQRISVSDPSEEAFWPHKKSSNNRPLNFHIFWVFLSVFVIFPVNSEPFWVNSGTPWASFFDVFWGYHFCSVFSAILQQISKI